MSGRRALLVLLGTVAAGVATWALLHARGGASAPSGLSLDVVTVDPMGRPVAGARAAARYASVAARTDASGRAVLRGVRLRTGDEPSPASIAAALVVEDEWAAPRPGHPPAVTRDAAGAWHARVVLERFARVRLILHGTELPEVHAWLEHDGPPGRVVAEEGVAVARPAQIATWRVFPGAGPLRVRVEGAEGVAARVTPLEPPGPGYLREVEIAAEASKPIPGHVLYGDLAPPDLGGRLEVFEILDDQSVVRAPYDVTVAEDGSFRVPFSGQGLYRLVPHLDFADVEPKTVAGGQEAVLGPAVARPWIEADVADADAGARPVVYDVLATGPTDAAPWRGTWTRVKDATVWFALPRPGPYRIAVRVAGDADHAPEHGSAEVTADAPRGYTVAVPFDETPWGTVVVDLDEEGATRRGASVRLVEPAPERQTTCLPGLGTSATFPHVPAGDVEAVVEPRDETRATLFLAGTLAAGQTLHLAAHEVRGGRFALVDENAAEETGDRVVRWERGRDEPGGARVAPDGVGTGSVRLRRVPGAPRWESARRVPPGRYVVEVLAPGRDAPIVPDRRVDVRAGETTEIVVGAP